MMCPTDEQQCESPRCLRVESGYFNPTCHARYIKEQSEKPSVWALAAYMKERSLRFRPSLPPQRVKTWAPDGLTRFRR